MCRLRYGQDSVTIVAASIQRHVFIHPLWNHYCLRAKQMLSLLSVLGGDLMDSRTDWRNRVVNSSLLGLWGFLWVCGCVSACAFISAKIFHNVLVHYYPQEALSHTHTHTLSAHSPPSIYPLWSLVNSVGRKDRSPLEKYQAFHLT